MGAAVGESLRANMTGAGEQCWRSERSEVVWKSLRSLENGTKPARKIQRAQLRLVTLNCQSAFYQTDAKTDTGVEVNSRK